MAVILKESESNPVSYPVIMDVSERALMLDHVALWQRIEAYCRVRWTSRQVIWTIEGGGEWEAPLTPASVSLVEVWESGSWVECTPAASPWGGYDLPGDGPFRITADVGGGAVPAAVSEAFRRFAEYLADATDRAGASSYSINMSGAIEERYERNPAWVARAMDLSGAADLLRAWKRIR